MHVKLDDNVVYVVYKTYICNYENTPMARKSES